MELTMLGTGNAMATACYNTCFVLSENGQHFLVDGGGGNELLRRLSAADIDWRDVRHIFLTHKHIDHLLGIVWLIRLICQNMNAGKHEGEVWLYTHEECAALLRTMVSALLPAKHSRFFGDRLHLVVVADGETQTILGHEVTFFDIGSTKATQFGFTMALGGRKLTCCGDEPCSDKGRPYAAGSEWLLHEAFCLHAQADIFSPYEKHHSTVKDACQLAETLGVQNLLLYHTEDKSLPRRKELYTAEGQQYFHGNLFIPDDMERIQL